MNNTAHPSAWGKKKQLGLKKMFQKRWSKFSSTVAHILIKFLSTRGQTVRRKCKGMAMVSVYRWFPFVKIQC